MKALIVLALAATAGPAIAAGSADRDEASATRDQRFCTRIERRSGSRMAYQRVCLTQAEWRERLGADWRQHLTGRPSIEEQLDSLEARTSPFEQSMPDHDARVSPGSRAPH
ncbi:MAG: hypothetical protein QOJ53_2382 [Sphingomonadales bacterium]|jgi:hypothetical protein|nr:hypothetical protein [Sphingomonadales bacterium]MEA3043816.1 hypothetical protein [Sphingomonadales bacterium]MEA3048050.1 hypothetical protein [Sphingomonadales bacterium]